MSYVLKEITPQDPYIVKMTNSLELNQVSHLVELYQPIIGSETVTFYLTLCNHLPLGQIGFSRINLHRKLMSQMYLPMHSIIKSRKILEAVGLLKTRKYKHKETAEYIFEYSIVSPLSPINFFQSDILSVLLLNRVGKTYFQILKKRFISETDWNQESYTKDEEITKSFDEIFNSVLASEIKIKPGSELDKLLQPLDPLYINNEKQKINIKNLYLDIEFIKGMVSDIFPLEKNLNKRLVDLLQELAFLYRLSEIDIINLLKDPTIYNNENKIEEKFLRNRIKEKYQYEQKEILIVNKEDYYTTEKINAPNTQDKAERHQWILEKYSPIELMEHYQGGGKIPDADLNLIESLIYDYKLPLGVVNVLIEYIMLSNEYKLPRKLTEKIAGHWKRLNIKTVEEALTVAKKEHKMYKEWKDGRKTKSDSNNSGRNQKVQLKEKKEKIPDYILKQEEKYHQNMKKQENSSNDLDIKAKINQLLKDLGEA